ncbi:MAG: DUF2182 domain-containing protein [Nitrospinota bacterium]
MQSGAPLEALLRRDRAIVVSGLAGMTALAWAYMLHLAWGMGKMDIGIEMAMPRMVSWGAWDFILMFVMWAVMMVAMMVPSASPMILFFAFLNRRRHGDEDPFVPTGVFLLGYVAVWSGFSVLATFTQWALHAAALLSPMMASTSPILGGALLVAAGIFQWTSLKRACLRRCRSPLGFLMTEWREGKRGAFTMGLKHGGFCLACCWFLMGVLFVAGVMNLLWVATIAIFVLLEKVAPGGEWVGRAAGGLLVGWGLWMVSAALA